MSAMKTLSLFAALTSVLSSLSSAQSTFHPQRPPSIPLAVRSPYLSTWLPTGSDGGDGGYLYGEWPSFWTLVHGNSEKAKLGLTQLVGEMLPAGPGWSVWITLVMYGWVDLLLPWRQ